MVFLHPASEDNETIMSENNETRESSFQMYKSQFQPVCI